MADDRLPMKRAAELRDCVKRDVRKAGEEEDWKKTGGRGGWKRLVIRQGG